MSILIRKSFISTVILVHSAIPCAAHENSRVHRYTNEPIPVTLTVDVESTIEFREPIHVGIPERLVAVLRSSSIAGVLYLTPITEFSTQRVIVRGERSGKYFVLDVSASKTSNGPKTTTVVHGATSSNPAERTSLSNVALSRFAAQQIYAPTRLLTALPAVHRVPISDAEIPLLRDDRIRATVLGSWRHENRYVSAVELSNLSENSVELTPALIRGRWLTASFNHFELKAVPREASITVIFLTSEQPIEDVLRDFL